MEVGFSVVSVWVDGSKSLPRLPISASSSLCLPVPMSLSLSSSPLAFLSHGLCTGRSGLRGRGREARRLGANRDEEGGSRVGLLTKQMALDSVNHISFILESFCNQV